MAERVGFEPTVPCGTPDFESGTIVHSATSPFRVGKPSSETAFLREINAWIEKMIAPLRPTKPVSGKALHLCVKHACPRAQTRSASRAQDKSLRDLRLRIQCFPCLDKGIAVHCKTRVDLKAAQGNAIGIDFQFNANLPQPLCPQA